MTTEKLISTELHQKSSIYGHVEKLFLESIPIQKNKKQQKNENSKQNLAFFSKATDSENVIIQIYTKTTK